MSPSLPISPKDPAFIAFCCARQMAYVGAERWRYTRALDLAEWSHGSILTALQRSHWAVLGLYPQDPTELQARLDQLNEMETAALTRDEQTLWTIETGAMLANAPH